MRILFFLAILVSISTVILQAQKIEPIQPVYGDYSRQIPFTDLLDSDNPPDEENLSIYNFSLYFDQTSKSVNGTLKFDFFNKMTTSLTQLYFHLWPEAPGLDNTEDQTNASLEIQSITNETGYVLDLEILEYTNLIVNLSGVVEPSNRTCIFIEFNTTLPYAESGDRFGWSTQPFNISNFGNWYPQLAVYENSEWDTSPYAYGGEAFYSEVAIYDVTIETPVDLIAAASGELVTNESAGPSEWLWRWKTGPVRDFFFSLSPHLQVATRTYQDTTILSYFHPDDEYYGLLVLDIVEEDLSIFGTLFEPYPYSTISVVETPAWFGGMEYPNIVLITQGCYNSEYESFLRDVVSHEVAHNWFAYLVGSDSYAEPWLDEGFATYCGSYLYFESTGRSEVSAGSLDYYQQHVLSALQYGYDYKIDQSMAWWETKGYYWEFIYCKGFCVVHMLREVMGDEAFFEGLQSYFDEWAYENAHIADFITIMEENAGYDLDWFFDEWLDSTGLPEYQLVASQATIYPNRTVLTMEIYQNQAESFIMPLDVNINIKGQANPFETIVWVNESMQTITIEIAEGGIPILVELDPEGWVLQSGTYLVVSVGLTGTTTETTQTSTSSAFDATVLCIPAVFIVLLLVKRHRKRPHGV